MSGANQEPKILIVDSWPYWRQAVAYVMKRAGMEFKVTVDAETALGALARGGLTGVVVDGMNGGWRPVANTAARFGLPVVVLSTSEQDLVDAQAEGLPTGNKMTIGTTEDLEEALGAVLGIE